LLGALRRVRQPCEQLQPPARQPDRFPVREAADVIVGCLLKILHGPLVVGPAVKVHRQLAGNLTGALAVERLPTLPYSPVEPDSRRRRQPLVQRILIQNVYEAVPAYRFAVRQDLNAAALNELTLAGQLVAARFYGRT